MGLLNTIAAYQARKVLRAAAETPAEEAARLLILQEERIRAAEEAHRLILPPDEYLASMCAEARAILKTPWSTFSIMDGTRQYVVASDGYGKVAAALLQRREGVPLETSMCVWVVGADQTIARRDVSKDPLMGKCIAALTVRGYLGAPVRYLDKPIGTLAFYGKDERKFRPSEREVAERYADAIGRTIVARS